MAKKAVLDSRGLLGPAFGRPAGRGLLGPVFAVLGLSIAACGSDRGGIVTGDPSTGATGGATGVGGTSSDTSGTSSGGTTDVGGATGAGGSSSSGAAGSEATGSGGAGIGADGGGSGGSSMDDAGSLAACIFHTDRPEMSATTLYAIDDAGNDVDPGDAAASSDGAREGGGRDGGGSSDGSRADATADAGPAPSITVQTSPFVGPYLADSTGKALYTYGGDMAGDCQYAPISGCEKDCLVAWPLFDAGPRTLAPSLNDGMFGTILRADGASQTTYYGWPLYYYRTDVGPGTLTGQAKSRTWHAATVIPMGLMVMKGVDISRYLADGEGKTLYVYDQDTKGTATTDPVSACTGACLVDHPGFFRSRLSVVSSLETTDFSTFLPSHVRAQIAYKGAPLYRSAADARSGDLKGATAGWSVALP